MGSSEPNAKAVTRSVLGLSPKAPSTTLAGTSRGGPDPSTDNLGAILRAIPQAVDPPELIVFATDRDGQSEIYVMNPDGSEQTRLTGGSGK